MPSWIDVPAIALLLLAMGIIMWVLKTLAVAGVVILASVWRTPGKTARCVGNCPDMRHSPELPNIGLYRGFGNTEPL